MADEINQLSSKEYDAVGWALFNKINEFDGFPDGIKLDYQKLTTSNCIGFFTTPGGKYVQKYVTGGFLAQLPFDVFYKLNATNNEQLLKAEEVLNNLAEYLQERKFPTLTRDRVIEDITMNSITYRTQADDDGTVKYVRSGVLRYEKI
jgi:hypothetical protein